uniref:Phosphoinositide phospholipase C n=1 Tax=Haemonchus placei TaxID=6290 RepID=A0A0N4X9Z1_HAEPC
RYGSSVGWFPASYVQEILPEKVTTVGAVASNYNTIELAGTVIERVTDGEKQNVIKISHSAQQWTGQQWLLAARSIEEADDWQNQLWDLTRSVNNKISVLRTKEKSARIAAELSNLVVYCQAVPFDAAHVRTGSFYEMCSFVENKLDKLLERGLVTFNIRQLSRVYPHGSRITSANYNPVPMWNASCHMVALNYQTGDKAMQLNQGKFMANGRCGYVLKPEYMLDEGFDPLHGETTLGSTIIRLTVQVIAGRHLSRRDKHKGICSPFVEVELIGLPCDERSYKTRTIASNGLNPIWNQTFVFEVTCPEMALLRFSVEDGDFVGPKTDPFIGQAVFPLDCIRTGHYHRHLTEYRHPQIGKRSEENGVSQDFVLEAKIKIIINVNWPILSLWKHIIHRCCKPHRTELLLFPHKITLFPIEIVIFCHSPSASLLI